ncbi:MAG: hypothetical protein Q8O40_17200, partial [Chloroflexota bacterium]|nr:hypothetical protein [Chloroflexota bacterium]
RAHSRGRDKLRAVARSEAKLPANVPGLHETVRSGSATLMVKDAANTTLQLAHPLPFGLLWGHN